MFTGLIEKLALVSIAPTAERPRLQVVVPRPHRSANLGDSIAINGVCLTVIEKIEEEFRSFFAFDLSTETLEKTSLSSLQREELVNLEWALRAGDPLGGHFVSGHIDQVGIIQKVETQGDFRRIEIEFPPSLRRFLIEKGSVAMDGVSLTVNSLSASSFDVAVIPHTLKQTTIQNYKKGQRVNLEFDPLGKYIVQLWEKTYENRQRS